MREYLHSSALLTILILIENGFALNKDLVQGEGL